MANSDKNILITPQVGGTTEPTIVFTGADNTPITLRVLDDGTVSFEGTAGQLFSISDGLTGTIFSVNDISGIPSIEVLDDGTVKLAEYGGTVTIGGTDIDNLYQSLDSDLTAIAALSGTSGFLKKTAADTWSLDTNTYLTGNQTITLSGDVSGSGTTSISVTVNDDSHNHIISNVDGLQTSLDAKLDSSSYTASDVLNKIKTVDGATSGLDADLLDGQHGSYYLDWTNTTNKPDPTITLGGDASGSLTLTDLAGGTLTVTVADDSHNHIISNVDGLQTALDAKAPLASPTLTGTPTAPTAASGTNTTQIATTAFVASAVSGIIDSAPTTLDTLNELAAALGDDPNFATTVTNLVATKQPLDADLTAIAGLAGTSGFLKKAAADTWTLDTNTYLTSNQTITLSGDVSGSGTTAITVTVSDNSHTHNDTTIDGLDASAITTGTIAGDRGVTAGSASSSFVEYNGTTATAGQFYGGTTTPTGTTRLNYGGYFYPTFINLAGSADTATAATHYFVETGSDGFVRPKTLANVRTEIVTTAAVNSAAATTVGTITSGTWQGSSISTTYTAAKVTSVNGATGAITGLATLASPTFTGTVILPTSATGGASVRIPHGTAPSSPTNGDVWTTTAGLYARINGSTVGPYGIGTARTFYQATAPTSPSVGDIWVDSDEAVTSLNSNDYVLKSELGDYGFNSFFLSGM